MDTTVETDAALVVVAQCQLQLAEQSTGAREGVGHGTEFT
jgi:hypothetical protein